MANVLEGCQIGSATMEVSEGPDGALLLRFKGNIDLADPGEVMDPALSDLHDHVINNRVPEVVADFTGLQFCNSSGIKALITWVMRQMELTPDQRYPVKFLYTKSVTWQQTSLKAITLLAKGVVTAEAV